MTHTVNEPGRQTPVVVETDVLVVGGGPAGQAAAVAAARAGAEVTLARALRLSGRVWPRAAWSWCSTTCAPSARSRSGGLALEIIDRMQRIGACVAPPLDDCFRNDADVRDRWVRWGFEELYARRKPKPIVYSAVVRPRGLEAGVAGDGARGRRAPPLSLVVLAGPRRGRRGARRGRRDQVRSAGASGRAW